MNKHMTNSERIASCISEKSFFKDFVYENLLFKPIGTTEKELCDLLLYFGNNIVVFQIKERNQHDKTDNLFTELKWLEKKSKSARRQIKDTIGFIKNNNLIFQNKQGKMIALDQSAQITPLVLFDNDMILKYPRCHKSSNENGLDVNLISLSDFQKICSMNITPYELIGYLHWRLKVFLDFPVNQAVLIANADDAILFNCGSEEGLFSLYIEQTYGRNIVSLSAKQQNTFKFIISNLWKRTITNTSYSDAQVLINFLIRLDRVEIKAFVERIILAIDEAETSKCKLIGNLHSKGKYIIFFISGSSEILSGSLEEYYALEKAKEQNVEKILIAYVYWEDRINYRIDFKYITNGINEED